MEEASQAFTILCIKRDADSRNASVGSRNAFMDGVITVCRNAFVSLTLHDVKVRSVELCASIISLSTITGQECHVYIV